VECPVEVAADRDADGMYARARRGEVEEFTGVNAPYEPPLEPEVHIRSDVEAPSSAAWKVLRTLELIAIVPQDDAAARMPDEDEIRRRLAALGYI
jgi:adenylylsulfate kinase-like enzyme